MKIKKIIPVLALGVLALTSCDKASVEDSIDNNAINQLEDDNNSNNDNQSNNGVVDNNTDTTTQGDNNTDGTNNNQTDNTQGQGTDTNNTQGNGDSQGGNNQTQTYTVEFNSNGGSTVTTQTVEENSKVTKPADPTREETALCTYTFAGWYKDEALTQEFDFNTATIVGNITLYAKWTETKKEAPFTKTNTTVYMVGDSTMCEYDTEPHYYPRYGYGTQMYKYFDSEYVTINNLALSGRSSVSFLSEGNYTTLTESISEGDYLIIGWGHNDEKYGTATFRNAKYDSIDQALADDASFQRCVYDNYVQLALNKGAYPILATPIVRLDTKNDYTGASAHVTDYGDYRQATIDLAEKYNIPYVDLTTLTKEEYTKLGYDEAIKYHDIAKGTDESEGALPDWSSVDKTHINYYGATYVSYEFANALKDVDTTLKHYVKEDITKPTEDILVKYSGYKWSPYAPVDLSKYSAAGNLGKSGDWYGTAFGDIGGNPQGTGNGYWAKSTSEGVYKVGQGESTGTTAYKGKIDKNSEGAAYMFQKLPAYTKFKITAEAKILSYTGDNRQGGFGLTLLDACWINETAKDATKLTGGTYAGILTNSASSHTVNFSRNMALTDTLVKSSNTYSGSLAAYDSSKDSNTVFYFEIERTGQEVYCRTKIGTETTVNGVKQVTYGQTYETKYVDFDYFLKDNQCVYLAMFGARGYLVEFTNVNFTNNGEYSGA